MALSAIYVLDLEGKVVIYRNYRNSKINEIEEFLPALNKLEDDNSRTPIISIGTTHFAYVKLGDLYIVSSMDKNVNMMLVFTIIYKIVQILSEYFKELEIESIRDNFVIIYELLDEVLDYGYPQITDTNVLKTYITQSSHKLEKKTNLPSAVTGSISWRPSNLRYRKNEVFVDVIESLNATINCNGTVLHSEVTGSIKMKVNLSGMPQLRLGLNDKFLLRELEADEDKSSTGQWNDIKFHQCVQLSRFTNDKTINFIPPDGEFELMSYRMDTSIKPLVSINPIIQHYPNSRILYNVTAATQFRRSSTAFNIEIRIPVPSDVDSPSLKASAGVAKYVPEANIILWLIKSFQGGKENLLTASMCLPSIPGEESDVKRHPIEVSFIIPYFTISGIQVKYLKVIEKSAYKALTWVRYITQNGQYQIRTKS